MPRLNKDAHHRDSAAKWPDLRHKYRELAIPAVVAAVLAEKGEERRRDAQPNERDKVRHDED